MNYEFQDMEELNNVESLNQDIRQEFLGETKEMRAMTSSQVGAIAYEIQRISDIPAVKEKIQEKQDTKQERMIDKKIPRTAFVGFFVYIAIISSTE